MERTERQKEPAERTSLRLKIVNAATYVGRMTKRANEAKSHACQGLHNGPVLAYEFRSEAPCAKFISQNRAVVQPLTSMAFGFVRPLCHTPYICRGVNDFESQRGPFRGLFLPFRPFHHGVFGAFRNILFAGWLAPISIEHEARASGRYKGLRLHVPQ